MNKKGFTLMELLAVIVILAVLALLVIPITTNLIKTSKQQAFKISVGQVRDNILFHYAKDWLLEGMTEDKVFNFDTNENLNLLTVSGRLPSSGTISINPQGKISINVNNGVYCAVKTIEQDSIQVGEIVNGTCEITGESVDQCSSLVGFEWKFNYISTGEDRTQDFVVPCAGDYQLEVWGAQGGSGLGDDVIKSIGGYGGYATGIINLEENNTLYINVGGRGVDGVTGVDVAGGYNGGGQGLWDHNDNESSGSGGGATHIATENRGVLSNYNQNRDEVLIVAAGGGGGAWVYNGANAGGYIGSLGEHNDSATKPGNTKTSTGYAFGQGGVGQPHTYTAGAGGGAGWYGGYGGQGEANPGAGGSSYIGNANLKSKYMYCYNCTTSTEEDIYTISGKMISETPISATAKQGNGYAKITYLGRKTDERVLACLVGKTWEYDYKEVNGNGVEQVFTPTCDGYYKLEVWGAQGGSVEYNYQGGRGAYSTGVVRMDADEPLYINVGGQGKLISGYNETVAGGYNGGGIAYAGGDYYRYSGSGGGATHIALDSGLITTFKDKQDKLLIVSGGGSGTWYVGYSSNWETKEAGHAGGYKGTTASSVKNGTYYYGEGGTQDSGNAFGQGYNSTWTSAGGGGGYYTGYAAAYGVGGPSSYIGNNLLYKKSMYCYKCDTSNEIVTNTKIALDASDLPKRQYAKNGNGYAVITYMGANLNTSVNATEGEYWNFKYKAENNQGVYQEFTVPVTGTYKIELWGAAGGDMQSYTGGKGAYTSGTIELTAGRKLYVYVGEHIDGYAQKVNFNGGGMGCYSTHNEYNANGGGATDIRLVNGDWDNFDSLKSRIMVAAGGGGANYLNGYSNQNGGAGGALTGINGNHYCAGSCEEIQVAQGGTQTQGGLWADEAPSYNGKSVIGGFGYGGSSTSYTAEWIYHAGGGGGYYGGGAGGSAKSNVGSGAGGSSFISGYTGCNAIAKDSTSDNIIHTNQPNHYSGLIFENGVMIPGNQSMPSYNSNSKMTGNSGNGHARITLLEIK